MAELYELKPEELHQVWPLLLRGANEIKHRLKPNWLPEDLYAALVNRQVNCVIARRGERFLGYLIYSKQLRIFNFQPELFIWAAWNLPVREWLPEDNMPAVVASVWNYIANIAKTTYSTNEISWMTRPSRARAFARKYKWMPTWVTMTARV